jgi:opine dehydrogenase
VPVREVTVLGGGHGALAVAGDLARRGFSVRLAVRNRSRFAQLFKTGVIRLSGAVEGVGELRAVTDDHRAVCRGADVVLIPLPATAQVAMAERVAGAIPDGTVVALLPGNLGSQVMRPHLPGVIFAEAATLPYGARQRGPAAVAIALVAHHDPTGVRPRSQIEPAIALLRELYPAEPVEDVLSAALLNSNGALHAPLVCCNAGPIERVGAYDLHVEGTTPGIRRVIEALDRERMLLREALGYAPPHWPLADYYRDADWFYGPGAFSHVQQASVWRERIGFDHRYFAEDVACGLALWASLGRALGVPTPLTRAFLLLANALASTDWEAQGRTLENLGAGVEDLRRD